MLGPSPPPTPPPTLCQAPTCIACKRWLSVSIVYRFAHSHLRPPLLPPLAPRSVIFVDEIDSFLSKRGQSSNEHEALRKMKNEFMTVSRGTA